jgi:sulfur-oxidizing protein SoxX
MKLTTFIAAIALTSGAALAGEVKPAEVSFTDYGAVETSLTGVPGDPVNGAAVMTNRGKGNCVACHEVTALMNAPFHGEVGPTLDGVADRWNEAELRGIVANAKKTYDGTIMPSYYKNAGYIRPGDGYTGTAAKGELEPILTAQEVEDVVAFLTTLTE